MSELRLRRPAEGWLSLVLVAIMALVVAWAVDDPAYVNGKDALTDSLGLVALLGVAVGFSGPKLGWSRWTTHLVGALFAGLVIPVLAGSAVAPGASIPAAFGAAAGGTVEAYLDLAWRGLRFTNQEVHYIVVLGGVIWATGQFLAYAVFGHGRPMNAIVITGLVLVANMALTVGQLPYLVAFTTAALFLLIEMHAVDERATWLRRRIGDPSAISSRYLRGGTVFIVGALLGSMVLTTRAASNPLAGAWEGVDEQLIEVGEELARILPDGGTLRSFGGVTFGPTADIRDTWFSDAGIAFTATVPPNERDFYWRAATYDTFRLNGWVQTNTWNVRVDGGQRLLQGTPEDPSDDETRPLTVTIRPDEFRNRVLLSPGIPVTTSRSAEIVVTGAEGWFAGVELPGGRAEYTVEARLLDIGEGEDQITGNQLEAAGTQYPAEVSRLYTAVPDGAIGPDAAELLQQLIAEAGTTNPFVLAQTMQAFLRDADQFRYSTDVSGIECASSSAVECFARTRTGYCLYYASTMAILLRAANPENPIPTRLVQGFLPGERVGNIETVENRNAHAWVEVFFPGYGWIPFDPTGGNGARPTVIPDGPPVASAAPTPSASGERDVPDPTRRIDGDTGAGGVTPPTAGGTPGDRTLLILLTVLLGMVVLTIAVAAWLRGPRGEVSPDTAWGSMSRVASRLGFGPRPTQTVYEYAATLGELVPVAQGDLRTVADAKVESAYANVRLGGARLDAVRDATRRLRITLLRLALRRSRQGGPRRR